MKRHTNKNIKILGAVVAVLAMTTVVVEFAMPTRAAKTDSSTADVQFTINSTLNLQVGGDGEVTIDNVQPGQSGASESFDVTVGTNSAAGYYLSATAGDQTSSDMTSDTSEEKITHLSSADEGKELAELTDNSWAVLITGADSSVSVGKYIGLPQEIGGDNVADRAVAGKKLVDASAPDNSKKVSVKVGVKVGDTLDTGTYKSYLNFYAVTK